MSLCFENQPDNYRFTLVSAFDDAIDWDRSAVTREEWLLSDHSETQKLQFIEGAHATEFICRLMPATRYAELQAMLPAGGDEIDRPAQVRVQMECFRLAVVEIRNAEGWRPERWMAADGLLRREALDRGVVDPAVVQELGYAAFMRQSLNGRQRKNL